MTVVTFCLTATSEPVRVWLVNLPAMSVRKLSKELQNKSANELNEIPTRIPEDLKLIREWLEQQPHLHARTDDQWLLSFLRGCKFSLQRAKQKLELFYTMRTALPEFFTNRDPLQPEIQEVLKLGLWLPSVRSASPDAPRVILVRCEPANPSEVLFVNVIKTVLMIVDILVNEDDNFVISGQQIYLDLKGATLGHIVQATPSICKKVIVCLQGSYPTRPKGFHVINMPTVFESVLNIVKALLTTKLRDRIHIYSGNKLDDGRSSIPTSVLPKEYGGEGESLEDLTAYWKTKVESYRDWFLEDAKYGSNEKLRIEKSYTDELLGVEGSFRKLDID